MLENLIDVVVIFAILCSVIFLTVVLCGTVNRKNRTKNRLYSKNHIVQKCDFESEEL